MTSIRSLRLAASAAVVLTTSTLAACGATTPTSNVAAISAAGDTVLPAGELERQLAGGFREALGRVAVMQQPTDGAADLGQDLPEGLVGAVHCGAPSRVAASTTPTQRSVCQVSWRTAAGTAKRTAYAVRLTAGRCFVAAAQPALPDLHDATIQTYAENPLDRIVSLVPGC